MLICNLSNAQCPEPVHPDYDALMDFYISTNGDNWYSNAGWVDGASGLNCDPCDGNWTGLTCVENRVTAITLVNNNLNGTLPESISQFEHLGYLDLSRNTLTGAIPESIFSLPRLMQVSLWANQLESIEINNPITESLQGLDLSHNNISSTLPKYFLNENKIWYLYLDHNNFNDSIEFYYDDSELFILDLSNNLLSGSIPSKIFTPKYLTSLYLNNNQFSSQLIINDKVPNSLNIINLSENQLSGAIPKNMSKVNEYNSINFSNNKLNELPDSLYATVLDLSYNELVGCYPQSYKFYCGSNSTLLLEGNPNLPWVGDFHLFCGKPNISDKQTGAACGEYGNLYIQYDCTCKEGKPILAYETKMLFKFYPNPAKDFLVIHPLFQISQNFTVSIYNSNGNKVLNEQAFSTYEINEIDISNIQTGIYMLMIQSETGPLFHKFSKL